MMTKHNRTVPQIFITSQVFAGIYALSPIQQKDCILFLIHFCTGHINGPPKDTAGGTLNTLLRIYGV